MRKIKNKKLFIKSKPIPPFKSQLEKKIYDKFKNHFPNQKIKINKRGLIKSNKRLELDLYFPKYKIGIEIQGPFHVKNETIILKDFNKKLLFMKEKNIKIIYIYTNTYKNKIYSIKKCIKIINNEEKKKRRDERRRGGGGGGRK